MLDNAREAVTMIQGKNPQDLNCNRILELALVRLVEVVGEAANRVSVDCRLKYPSIPWQQVIGMRNRLIHGYDKVDLNVLWDTVDDDLPHLIEELEKILRSETTL
jgi:uncharacterized protein with HEPN domain